MALTKAQVSLVTVATLGAAPGGFTADLLNFGSQVEVAALALSVSPTQAAQTNAEFALQVAKNLGATDALSLYKALEAGTSRADAVVDFANAQLVAQGGNIAKVKAAEASNSTSTDLTELVAVVTPKATAATDATIIEFKDNNGSAVNVPSTPNTDKTGTPIATEQTIAYVGKDQIINGKATKVAADFTFQLKDQIGEADIFKGQFLSPILDRKAADNSGSQVILELRNLREAVDSVEPLKSLPTNGIAFTLNGVLLKIADQGTNKAIDNALTYDDLRTAIENRLAELARGENLPDGASGENTDPAAYAQLASFTVEKGGLFTAKNEKGETVSGNQIVLTDKAGATLEPLAFTQSSDIIVGSGYTLYGELKKEDAKPITKLITTNLEADNVGYGSQGASVNLAGQSASDKGVEEIKLTANNGVWFSKLESKATTDHLQRIELQSGSNGYLNIGTQNKESVVDLTNENFNVAGLKDVQVLSAANAGSVAINSFVSKGILGRYNLDSLDANKQFIDENAVETVDYTLGSTGNNVLNLAISTDVLQAFDTEVVVTGGSGADVITVMATKGLSANGQVAAVQETAVNASWLANQQQNDNIVINAGAGNDWILTPGSGNATINAGSGDDVVRVDNAGDRAVFVFNSEIKDINALKSFNDKGFSTGLTGSNPKQTHEFFKAQVQVKFKGFESKFVTIKHDAATFTTSNAQINQAIKEAVNADPVLSKLIYALDNNANALAIESLIDGLMVDGDLVVSIIPPLDNTGDTATAKQKLDAADAGQLMIGASDLAAYNAAKGGVAVTSIPTAQSQLVGTAGTPVLDATGMTGFTDVVVQYPHAGAVAATGGLVTTAANIVLTTAGTAVVNEVQTVDLSNVSLLANETLVFTSTTLTTGVKFTNTSKGVLSGEALATAIAEATGAGSLNANGTFSATSTGSDLVLTTTAASATADAVTVQAGFTSVAGTPPTATPTLGSASGAESDNVINLGTGGNDILVLGTGATSNDTVVLEGNFVYNTIVNFTAGGTIAGGADLLDFTSYLTKSAGAIKTTGVTKTALDANEVTVVDFGTDLDIAALDTAAALATGGNAKVDAVVNDATYSKGLSSLNDADWKFIFDKSGVIGAAANGGTVANKSIVLVENTATLGGSDGEYLVFQATHGAGSALGAFDSVKLVGTLDFGADMSTLANLNLAQFA